MPDIISIGEILVDFVAEQTDVNLAQTESFRKAAGGAPANVAVGTAKLGRSAAFVGKVGHDAFGRFLIDSMSAEGVDVSGCRIDPDYRTTIGFAGVQSDGKRDFLFYRNPGADMMFAPSDIQSEMITSGRILHFGTVGLAFQPSRDAHLYALDLARNAGMMISYDPNIRLGLWKDHVELRDWATRMLEYAHIVKVSEEEWEFLTGTTDLKRGSDFILERGAQLVTVTLGPRGCYFRTSRLEGEVPGFNVEPVDCLGAGDGFMAALLDRVIVKDLMRLSPDEFEREIIPALRFANTAGALTCTRRGAFPALPYLSQVEEIIRLTG